MNNNRDSYRFEDDGAKECESEYQYTYTRGACLTILGIDEKECPSFEFVKKRYRELAKKFHSDVNPEASKADEKMSIINNAFKDYEHYHKMSGKGIKTV